MTDSKTGRNAMPGGMQAEPESSKPEKTARKRLPHAHEQAYRYLLGACLASLILSTFASVFFYRKWSEAEDRYISALTNRNEIAQHLNLLKYEYDRISGDMKVVTSSSVDVISLMLNDSVDVPMARVYWNRHTRETYVDVRMLPMPDAGRQYRLWAFAFGQPYDAGVVNMDDGLPLQRMRYVSIAQKWVIAVEPKDASVTPGGTEVFLTSEININGKK